MTLVFFFLCVLEVFSQKKSQDLITKNLAINTTYDEYGPFLIDSIFLFTSNRENFREDKLLKYTEKVYYTSIVDTVFGKIKKFTYKANTDANSALVGVCENNFYFYRSYFPNNGELFMATKKQEIKIKPIKKVPDILSDFDENSIATDGDYIYFTSNRSGNYDVYLQDEEGIIPLETLNSEFDEISIWLSSTGKELYFSSNRNDDFDVYVSKLINNEWQRPKKVPYPVSYPGFNDVDYRQYGDSVMFLASDRPGGLGGYDIYQLLKNTTTIKIDTSTIVVVEKNGNDSVPDFDGELKGPDSIPVREQVIIELEELELMPFMAEIQIGAYREINTLELFKQEFPCVEEEDIMVYIIFDDNKKALKKYVINKIFVDLDQALDKQIEIIERGCFPETHNDMPFIALLNDKNQRYAIFWEREQYTNKEVLWIKLNGQEIWRSK